MNSWLLEVLPRNALLISSADAEKLGLRQGDAIAIESPDGKISVKRQGANPRRNKAWRGGACTGVRLQAAGAVRQVIGSTAMTPDKTRSAGVNEAAFAQRRSQQGEVRKA